MLAAVLVLVVAATTLLGVAALLLGVTEDRALTGEVRRLQPADVDVTAFLVDLPDADLQAVRDETVDLLGDVLAGMDPTVTSTASSPMRTFAAGDGVGYLGTITDPSRRADLVTGRWPASSSGQSLVEAAVPDRAATRLGLRVGDRVRLDEEIGIGGLDGTVRLVVVGTYRPRTDWEGDPLSATGFDPAYENGFGTTPAYGPFLVNDAAFLASGSSVAGLQVTGHPDLENAAAAALAEAATRLEDASGLLDARVGDRVRITRVESALPATTGRLTAQRDTARSTVLVVLLLGGTLSLACLVLAGRLMAETRDAERALLVSLGLGRGQQLRTALAESTAVALAAAALAVPCAAVAHSGLTHLTAVRAAGLGQGPEVTWGLVVTAVVGAAVMALALVAPALDRTPWQAPSRVRTTVRWGVTLLLAGTVAVAWWQLTTRPDAAVGGGDLALTLAPAVFLLALVLVLVRAVPLLLGVVGRAGARARSLVLPLAATQAARRPVPPVAEVLVAATVAAATFGVALQSTWDRSQHDQADLRVGADVVLALPGPATAADAAAVATATGAGSGQAVVSPVANRNVVLGRFVGERGAAPVLVAIDSQRGGALLKGRLDPGRSWASVTAPLAPGPAVEGLPLPSDGSPITVQGQAPAGSSLSVAPTALVQDSSGFRSAVTGAPVRVDGRSHPVRWSGDLGAGRLVGVLLRLDSAPAADVPASGPSAVSIALQLPGAGLDVAPDPGWEVDPFDRQSPVAGATVSVEPSGSGLQVVTVARVDLQYLSYTGADLLTTAIPAPDVVPVVVSEALSDAVGAEVGGELSAVVDGVALLLEVTGIVPAVPSAPGRMAMLADIDTLSRALVHDGRLDPVADGWWLADPDPATVAALRGLQLGPVTTRQGVAAGLARGPLRVTVPAALLTLVVASGVLLLVGAGLVVGGDQRRRAAEVARLRALGLTRRDARRLLLAEHGAVLLACLVVGVVVGAASAVALAPHLVRSDLGAAPVPSAVVVWPWVRELVLTGGLLLACAAITAVVTAVRVRRADLSRLRTGDS